MTNHSLNPMPDADKYENFGGIYFPILQQDGSRVMTKIGSGKDQSHIILLGWLRQHDRLPGKALS